HPNGPPRPDAGITGLENQLAGLNLNQKQAKNGKPSAGSLALRPAYGTQGQKIQLYANFVQMNIDKNIAIHRYHIALHPEERDRKKEQIIKLLVEQLPQKNKIVSDYASTLLSTVKFDQDLQTIPVTYRGEGEDTASKDARQYQVDVEYHRTLTVSELLEDLRNPTINSEYQVNKAEIIQALNIVLKDHAKSDSNLFTVGKNQGGNKIFSKSDATTSGDLGNGLSAVRGFYTSVRPATNRLLLNINVSNGAFYTPQCLKDLFKTTFPNCRASYPSYAKQVEKYLTKLKVMLNHLPERKNESGQVLNRYKTVLGFADVRDGSRLQKPPKVSSFAAGPEDVSFWFQERPESATGAQPQPAGYRTVSEHFLAVYGIELNKDYPVLNVGTREKPNYLPAEACSVAKGQPWKKTLNGFQTDGMLKFAGRPPFENARAIASEGFQTVGLTPQINPKLNEFGIEFGSSLLGVEGRVLSAPKVKYDKTLADTQRNPGQWNLRNTRFTEPRNLGRWAILVLKTPAFTEEMIDRDVFKAGLRNGLSSVGINNDDSVYASIVMMTSSTDSVLESSIAKAASLVDFVVTILPNKDATLYSYVKRLCDVKYGIRNISFVNSTLVSVLGKHGLDQYFANVAMKFNLKLGGTNQVVEQMEQSLLAQGKTMLLGLDVTHPSPGSADSTPSVAAMVSSIDKKLAQWPATLSLQAKAKQEDITNLKEMLRRHLGLWIKRGRNLEYPENIVVYRDGVSEGQFDKVLNDELPQLRQACRELYPVEKQRAGLPRFTVMVVTKRHQTRFYPSATQDATKNSNTMPGTTVDRGVTEAQRWTFYQQGHAAIQGTARSAKYDVLLDEVFSNVYRRLPLPPPCRNLQDVVERFNLGLCYIYGRATKSVSLCTPAKYADMACERARCYLSHLFNGSPGGKGQSAEVVGVTPHEKIKDTMFYL
ncbi:hypothetical protein KEM54_006447, partial [Ascosphaera aggregata]